VDHGYLGQLRQNRLLSLSGVSGVEGGVIREHHQRPQREGSASIWPEGLDCPLQKGDSVVAPQISNWRFRRILGPEGLRDPRSSAPLARPYSKGSGR
jgi:hypothetical protein